jgi:hypothetical protein
MAGFRVGQRVVVKACNLYDIEPCDGMPLGGHYGHVSVVTHRLINVELSGRIDKAHSEYVGARSSRDRTWPFIADELEAVD